MSLLDWTICFEGKWKQWPTDKINHTTTEWNWNHKTDSADLKLHASTSEAGLIQKSWFQKYAIWVMITAGWFLQIVLIISKKEDSWKILTWSSPRFSTTLGFPLNYILEIFTKYYSTISAVFSCSLCSCYPGDGAHTTAWSVLPGLLSAQCQPGAGTAASSGWSPDSSNLLPTATMLHYLGFHLPYIRSLPARVMWKYLKIILFIIL